MRRTIALTLMTAAAFAATEQGWYPHEGGLMKYRVNIRFGEEPEDTMPDGWKFGRVSSVTTDSDGNVYVFQRGKKADPHHRVFARGQVPSLLGTRHVRQSPRHPRR